MLGSRLLISMALLTTLALAQAAAKSGYPAPVEASIEESINDCSPNTAVFEKGFVTTKDVNGDGVPDYILDYDHDVCAGSHANCGSAGCLKEIFASTGHGGFTKVFSDNVRAIQFAKSGGRPAIMLGLHGSACGKVGSELCNETLIWNGTKFMPAH